LKNGSFKLMCLPAVNSEFIDNIDRLWLTKSLKRFLSTKRLVALLLFSMLVSPQFSNAGEPVIRVAVHKSPSITVYGQGLTLIELGSGRVLMSISGKGSVRLRVVTGGLSFGKGTTDRQIKLSGRGRLKIGGRSYEGTFIFENDNGNVVAIEWIGLEDYIAGIINLEISSKWPREVIRAQAVAARTYAVYQQKQNAARAFDVESTVTHQVYGGAGSADDVAREAVGSTAGEVLTFDGAPILALFHSCCGGVTEQAGEVFSNDLPYLVRKVDPNCTDSPNFFWQIELGATELGRALGLSTVQELTVDSRSPSTRVSSISVLTSSGRNTFKGGDFRKMVGYGVLKSTLFKVKKSGGKFVFLGSGSGHGVGLCQWGAKGMAVDGKTYREILDFYYPGTALSSYY
jgi:stage II sporulation protein D (peptidoglycan lytic transglycosylase)